ncbi:MAG: acyltransferase [Deltaproteobacteria bacterium]|nr:acyltransferase [Deltaproteobacteria bacterium]
MNTLMRTTRGLLSLGLYVTNTLVCCTPLLLMTLLKLIVPYTPWRKMCNRILTSIAGTWIRINNFNQEVFSRTRLTTRGTENLDPKEWYLVLSNHQSWVDILVLQNIFHGKIPMLKFFLKKELIWVPVLGLAWWALDFPFMKRYSKKFLKKHPQLRGKDIDITRKACRRFRTIPVSIMNFVEGTRFTSQKHRRQSSPYNHLLKSKAGGIAFVLAAMGDQLNTILDVTIVYPGKIGSFWDFVCGKIPDIIIDIRSMPIDPSLVGNYTLDEAFRTRFQTWLNRLWTEKDARMDAMLTASADNPNSSGGSTEHLRRVA